MHLSYAILELLGGVCMELSYHGHSCVVLTTLDGTRLLIDPFISDNPLSDLDANTVECDYILLTHAHSDHFGDTLAIAHRCKATVIAVVELADYIGHFDINTHGMNLGGRYQFPFGSVKCVPALHTSSYNDKYMGEPCGFVINDSSASVYHAGDTALFSDMSLVGPVTCTLLPIGDNYTMGIEDAVKASRIINSEIFIPIHFNTFPVIEVNPYQFTNQIDNATGIVMEVGEHLEL